MNKVICMELGPQGVWRMPGSTSTNLIWEPEKMVLAHKRQIVSSDRYGIIRYEPPKIPFGLTARDIGYKLTESKLGLTIDEFI